MRKIMASLDIGSNTIKLVVGEMFRNKLNILAALEEETLGFKNGNIEDENELKHILINIFDKATKIVGIPIKQVIITIPPKDLEFQIVTGEITKDDFSKEINGRDIINVIRQSIKGNIKKGREYITLLPTSFKLDNGKKVRDPKKLESTTLGARGVLITSPKENIYGIILLLEQIGVQVIDIALNSIGDYYEYRIDDMNSVNGIIINIGHENTTVSLFNKGILTNTNNINIGGKNIDSDISYIYKTSIEKSKEVKEKFALAYAKRAKESNKYEVETKTGEKVVINQLEVTKIVQSRLEEILNLCKKQINLLTKKEISYIIITGGLTELRDFSQVLNKILKDKAIVGSVTELGVRNNKYGSAVGLIKYYDDKSKLKDKEYSIFSIEEQQALGGYNIDEKDDFSLAELFKNLFS